MVTVALAGVAKIGKNGRSDAKREHMSIRENELRNGTMNSLGAQSGKLQSVVAIS